MAVRCWLMRALGSSFLPQGLLFLPNGAWPHLNKSVPPLPRVGYNWVCFVFSPTEVPHPDARVLSTANGLRGLRPAATPREGKGGVILGVTMHCTRAANFGLVPISFDATDLIGGTSTSGVAGRESLRVCMVALSSSCMCSGGTHHQSMLTTPALSQAPKAPALSKVSTSQTLMSSIVLTRLQASSTSHSIKDPNKHLCSSARRGVWPKGRLDVKHTLVVSVRF